MKRYYSLVVVLAVAWLNASAQSVIVNSNPTMNDRFSKRSGSLRLSTTLMKIGRIKNNASKTDTIRIYNDGARNMTLSLGKLPSHLEVHLGTSSLTPKTESWIAIAYNAPLKNDYGFVIDRFELVTNDSVQPKKIISVSANIQEYFSPMTADDSLNIQKAILSVTSFDYGKIKQGSKPSFVFVITNEGKRDVLIRKIKSNCTCMKVNASKDTIPPGGNSQVSLEFDSSNKLGKDSRKVNVFLNDPARPEVVLEMKGEIQK
jgi:hypothetical protein